VKKGDSCSELVTRTLRDCSHEVTIPCKKWQKYQAGQIKIDCSTEIVVPCWNQSRCGHTALKVKCSENTA
ncbi:unnamed protein product, partial [Amoebophrya sp. A120]